MFDINNIMGMIVEEGNSTVLTPVPEGEYVARVKSVNGRSVTTKNGEAPILRVQWVIDGNPEVSAVTGRDSNTVSQDLWLDLTPGGTLDMGAGMNVGLGKLRAAVGQNESGRPWGFGQMVDQVARILVSHRTTDQGPFAEVKSVKAL